MLTPEIEVITEDAELLPHYYYILSSTVYQISTMYTLPNVELSANAPTLKLVHRRWSLNDGALWKLNKEELKRWLVGNLLL